MQVRLMTGEDSECACRILWWCYRWLGNREHLTPQQIDWLLSECVSGAVLDAEQENSVFWVASEAASMLGFIGLREDEITRLHVDPQHHCQGIGRLLFAAAERHVRANGMTGLSVVSWPSAVPFFEAMGMETNGHKSWTEPVMRGRTSVIMRKSLKA